MRTAFCFLVLFLACSFREENPRVSINHRTGGCGREIVRKSVQTYTDSCRPDELRWYYDESNRLLTLHLTAVMAYCGDAVELAVFKREDRFVMDLSIREVEALDCGECVFEPACDVPNVAQSSVFVEFVDSVYTLNLAADSGFFVLGAPICRHLW